MRSIEASGKTVKDAIRNGLAELGCDSDDVDIQVIEMGSPGLFGMFGKPAKVRLTVKADDPALDIEMPVLSLDAAGKGKSKPEKRKSEKPKPEKPAEKPVEKADFGCSMPYWSGKMSMTLQWANDRVMMAGIFWNSGCQEKEPSRAQTSTSRWSSWTVAASVGKSLTRSKRT